MTTASATASGETAPQEPSLLRNAWEGAKTSAATGARCAWTAARGIGSRAYDFAKANPVLTAAALDLGLNGGALTQRILTSGASAVAGSTADLGGKAAGWAWNRLFS